MNIIKEVLSGKKAELMHERLVDELNTEAAHVLCAGYFRDEDHFDAFVNNHENLYGEVFENERDAQQWCEQSLREIG